MVNLLSLQTECYKNLQSFQKSNDQNDIINAEQALLSYLKQYNDW